MKRILTRLGNNIFKVLIGILIIFSFVGCKDEQLVVQYQYKTLNELPEISKPSTTTITSKIILPFNYICISQSEYDILMNNWEHYKIWAEYNFELIKKRNLLIQKINKENKENKENEGE